MIRDGGSGFDARGRSHNESFQVVPDDEVKGRPNLGLPCKNCGNLQWGAQVAPTQGKNFGTHPRENQVIIDTSGN